MAQILDHHALECEGMPAILDALKKLEAELAGLGCRVEVHVTIHAPRARVANLTHLIDSEPTWEGEEAKARYYGPFYDDALR